MTSVPVQSIPFGFKGIVENSRAHAPLINFGFRNRIFNESFPLGNLSARASRFRLSSKVVSQAVSAPDFMATFKDLVGNFLRTLSGEPETLTVPEPELESPIKMTVLVIGATGRTGKLAVKKLLEKNHQVIAFVSSQEKAENIFCDELGLQFGRNESGGELVYFVGDLTDADSVRAAVKGVNAIVCAVGTRFKSGGFEKNGSPQEVFGDGFPILVRAAIEELENENTAPETVVLFDFQKQEAEPAASPADEPSTPKVTTPGRKGKPSAVAGWYILDDVIMGGISDGSLQLDDGKLVFSGTLRSEGGGFSSVRSQLPNAPGVYSGFDGIRLRVKGDGQRYKIGLRTQPEFTGNPHVALFDTVRGKWIDVTIPFDRFLAADQSNLIPNAAPLNPSNIYAVQILASLFQFNKARNPLATPGPFRLEVESIRAYRDPRPLFVLLSSAAVERNVRIQTEGERECSIPIVKLNPGGILTWKLFAENVLRSSGIPYSIVRACGLTEKEESESFLLEVSQGDAITGLISREEAAAVLVETLNSPEATNATFEVRRDELTKGLKSTDFVRLFRRLRKDPANGAVILEPASQAQEG